MWDDVSLDGGANGVEKNGKKDKKKKKRIKRKAAGGTAVACGGGPVNDEGKKKEDIAIESSDGIQSDSAGPIGMEKLKSDAEDEGAREGVLAQEIPIVGSREAACDGSKDQMSEFERQQSDDEEETGGPAEEEEEDEEGDDDLVDYLQSTGSILALAQKLGLPVLRSF